MAFQKAIKKDAKGRVAIVGPGGSGKSKTGLILARTLAGPNGKIAAIDTEHGSLSKYADEHEFDVEELSSYEPELFVAKLREAEQARYDVFFCDSLSHFWMGKGGALEWVDAARKRSSSRDDMAGWKEFRPQERAMIDAMIASPCHIVVTMRTKNEYVSVEKTVNGKLKTVREKVGLAPVQREGLEYEFDLVALMDDSNTWITDKTRCPFYTQKAIMKPSEADFRPFVEWLKGVKLEPVYCEGPCAGREIRDAFIGGKEYKVADLVAGTREKYGKVLCDLCVIEILKAQKSQQNTGAAA